MNPFAILLYCKDVFITLLNMNMAHIVFIAKSLTYWQCDNTSDIFHVTSLLNCFCINLVA
jgi:hypothetical protein